MLKQWVLLLIAIFCAANAALAEVPWVTYSGGEGPGAGRRIVLISGDEEYRSEEALPQLGKILSVHHGFHCTVLFAIDEGTGTINPNNQQNIPGLHLLAEADLMIIATRFRNLPDDAMSQIDDYLRGGRPILGMRTATHAFNIPKNRKYAHYGNDYDGEKREWKGGFGRLILGEKWISHHGHHKHEATRGVIPETSKGHPITRGIADGDIWCPSDVYGVRLPLLAGSKPLVLGQVTKRTGAFDESDRWFGMRPNDPPVDSEKNQPMMPVAWLKPYQVPGGKPGTAFTTTMGAATDLESAGLRRLLANAAYFLLDLDVPSGGTNVDVIGMYKPSAYGFHDTDYFLRQSVKPRRHVISR